MARAAKPEQPKKAGWFSQLRQTYQAVKPSDPKIGLYTLLAALVAGIIGFLIFWFLTSPVPLALRVAITVIGVAMSAALGGVIVFGRRAQKAMYAQIDGQKGAAAAALTTLRKGWRSYPMIAFNKQQDVVHRLVGPPGIVLIGEGEGQRLRSLLTAERRKHERVAYEVPITEIVCGEGEGEVPLSKLVKHVGKLKRQVKPAEMTDIMNRLKALDAHRSTMPLPKGPMPTSMKGFRGQMRGR